MKMAQRIANTFLAVVMAATLSPFSSLPAYADEPADETLAAGEGEGEGGESASVADPEDARPAVAYTLTASGAADEDGGDMQAADDGDPAELPSGTVSGDWQWKLAEGATEGTYELTFEYKGADDPAPTFAIPADFTSGISSALGDYAANVTKLTVPEGATSIGENAFQALTGLTEAEIGSTVASIGARAFGDERTGGGASNLASITFATHEDGEGSQVSDLATIGVGAFAGTALQALDLSQTQVASIPADMCASCSSLASVQLPATVTDIGARAFQFAEDLASVNLQDTKVKTVGANSFEGTALASVKFPATTTNINADAFNACSQLQSADFTDATALTVIRNRAFYGCDLQTLSLPDSLTSIGTYVFYNNKNLKTVDMPALRYFNSAPSSANGLFANCTSLEELTFHTVDGKTSYTKNNYLPNYSLQNDTALKKLDLSGWSDWNTTLQISNIFLNNDCSNLEEIVLPTNTNVQINTTSFQGKTGLSSLEVFTNPQSVKNIQASAFKGSGIQTADLTDWTGITQINEATFANCNNLKSVTIPPQVTTLGKQAFMNDQQLTDFRVDSTKLTKVSKDIFDGTGRLETVTIGKDVQEITADFFVATPTNEADVLFEGESIIKITAATLSGGASPLKDLAGTYWVSPEGVLYELNDDGTASLAYVPDRLESYTVPAQITTATDAGVQGATYTVDRMNSHAVHMATALTSLTFEAPGQVTVAPAAFTGRSSADDANGLAVNGAYAIDPDDFAAASVLCDYPLDEESELKRVPAIESESPNSDGKMVHKTTIAVNDKNIDEEDNVYRYKTGEKATYTIAISNEDNIAMNSVVRVYFAYDAPGQHMGSFPAREDPYNLVNPGSGNSYPCKVVETETPGIYYYEITGIQPGETLAFQNDVFYPSPNTPGGTLRIWTEAISKDEAAATVGKVSNPTDYVQLEWDTTPVTYDLTKERSPQRLDDSRAATLKVNEQGEARVKNLAFRFYETNQGSSNLTEGLDFIRWVQYEDVIDLPAELSWRPEVLQAIAAGQLDSETASGDGWQIVYGSTAVDSRDSSYTRNAWLIRLTYGGTTYDLAWLAFSDGTSYNNILGLTPSIVTGADGTQKLKLSWYVNNSTLDSSGSATTEYPTRRFYVRFGDDVILADVDGVTDLINANPGFTEPPLKVHNTIDETRHYSYSEDQTAQSDAYDPVSANAGMEMNKVWDNGTGNRNGGLSDPATVTISNTGIMRIDQWGDRIPARDENGAIVKDETGNTVYETDESGRPATDGHLMSDTLPYVEYITGDNMVRMLNAVETSGSGANALTANVGDWLTITITGVSLFTSGQFQPSEGTEQSSKYPYSGSNIQANADNGARVYQAATMVVTKNDEGRVQVTLSGDTIADNNRTYIIGEGGDYATFDEFFTAVGYMPTNGTRYKLDYYTHDFALKAGQKLPIHILSSTKTTPMMLTVDTEESRGSDRYHTNTAYVKGNVGGEYKSYSASTGYRHWTSELRFSKVGYANGKQISGNPPLVDDGSVVEYTLSATNSGQVLYDTQSMHDTMEGATVLLVPVAQNPTLTAPDGSALEKYVDNGTEYWLLNQVGTYENVVVGSPTRGGTQSYVAQQIVVSEVKSGGTRTSLNTTVHWEPFTNWGVGSGNTSKYINYKAIVSASESGLAPKTGGDEGRKYTVYNKGWLGDHQGHRLWDTCWFEYQVYRTFKWIVETDSETGDEQLLNYTRLKNGQTVTYKMEITNHATVEAKLSGSLIRDALPDTKGAFAWTRGDESAEPPVAANVTNLRYVGSDGVTITAGTGEGVYSIPVDGTVAPAEHDTYWHVESSAKVQDYHPYGTSYTSSQTRVGGYDITWDSDFTIHFPKEGKVTIYVDVTFPERPVEGSSVWDQYLAKLRGGYIYNTFYVDDLWDDVVHSLAAEGKPVLYKGVYDTGITTHTTSGTSYTRYTSHKSRRMYANGFVPSSPTQADLKAETVTYYTVLYNGSYDRMYLSDLQDQLPRGFVFNSMANYAGTGSSVSGTGNSNGYVGYFSGNSSVSTEYYSSYGASGYRYVTMDNSKDPVDENSITYVNANVSGTAAMGSDGRQHVTFKIGNPSNTYGAYTSIHYDSDVKKFYLNPGEALRFGYNVVIGPYANTDDVATNTVAMPYYDYYDMGFTLDVPDEDGKNGAVQHARAASGVYDNDGGCTLMTAGEVQDTYGMDVDAYQDEAYLSNEADGGNWLVSDVSLERAPVVPGMQKVVGGTTVKDANPTTMTIEGSRYNNAALYGTAYTGGAKTSDVINWRLRVFNEEGSGNDNVVSQLVNYTLVDTVVVPFSFCGQVFYNMYQATSATGTRVTPSSTCLFTLGSRTKGDTQVQIGTGVYPGNNGRMLNIGSAEDDSDDDWFQFNTGTKEGYVKVERNAGGEEVLTIRMVGSDYAVPAGHWMDLCAHTMFVNDEVVISEGKYNDVVVYPEQNYDPAAVAQGRARTVARYDASGNMYAANDGIQSGASIMLTQGYTTDSWKIVTEMGDAANTARSDGSPTYITLSEKTKTFKYDLYMEGPSAVMSKVVFIDHLPEPGDHSAFVEADKRYSDFTVGFLADNPDFKVTLAPKKGGTERTLALGTDYTLEVSTKSEYDRSTDWVGEGDGWTSIEGLSADELEALLSEARSFRVVIVDPEAFVKKADKTQYLMAAECQIHISFNAEVDDADAQPGQVAWNSFGYKYSVPLTFNGTEDNSTAIALEAQPLNVGVKYPAAPSLEKKLTMLQQKMEQVYEDVEVLEEEPVLDPETGEPVVDPETGEPVMQPKMVQAVDEDGNPVVDEDGEPVMVQASHVETRAVTTTEERPVYDPETGEQLVDPETGEAVTQTVEVPVMQPAYQAVVDPETGEAVLDADGNPVMEPVMETVAHPALEDITFGFVVYQGEPLAALDDALNMDDADVAAVLAAAGRTYIYVPLVVEAGKASAKANLWTWEHPATYDAAAGSFVDDENATWAWENGATYTVVELSLGDYNYELAELRAGNVRGTANNIAFADSTASVVALVATNEWFPEYLDVTGTKVWSDDSDRDGVRPASITVNLLADGEVADTQVVTADSDWSFAFEHLLRAHERGADIVYTVEEVLSEDAAGAYEQKVVALDPVVDAAAGTAEYPFVVTNTHVPETVAFSGAKTWDDDSDRDGVRPASITVDLLADGEVVRTATATEADGWKWSFADLPRYRDGGVEIQYALVERSVEDYSATVDGFDVTNVHTPGRTSVSVVKYWDDANDRDGIRPASVVVNLLADGVATGDTLELSADNNWTGSFTGLAKYRDGGVEIAYSVSEDPVPGYGAPEVSGSMEKGFVVKNPHEPATVPLAGAKTWNDGSDRDGVRPASITVRLLADGQEVASREVSASDGWKWDFTGMPRYRDGGEEIVYTLVEDPVAGYTSQVEGLDVVNTHEPTPALVGGTGDRLPLLPLAAVALGAAACAALAAARILGRRRRPAR